MATWADLSNYIRSNYKLQNDEGTYFGAVISFDDGRSQFVNISKNESQSGKTWVSISSPVGNINGANMNQALEYLANGIIGGLIKMGERHFVRHATLLNDLSLDQFATLLGTVVVVADEMEKHFVGGDAQ